VRVPETLRRQLFTRAGNQTGWRVLIQWMIANILVGAAIIALELIYPLSTRSPNLVLLISGALGLALGLGQSWVLRRFWNVPVWLWTASAVLSISAAPILNFAVGSESSQISAIEFGLLQLSLLGLIQVGILSRLSISSAGLWWLGALQVGLFNTILSFFLKIDVVSGFSSILQMVLLYSVSAILYAAVSGWILLSMLRSPKRGSTWLLRPNWVFTTAVGFSGGVFILVISDALLSLINYWEIVQSMVWGLMVAFAQWLTLRSYARSFAKTWFWVTWAAWTGGFTWLFLTATDSIIVAGIVLGLLVGFVQCLVWARYGIKPFQLLIWFLFNIIGLAFLFGALDTLLNSSFVPESPTMDQILLLFFLPTLLYGIITSWPLEPFLSAAIRNRQDSKETMPTGVVKTSPLSLISKIRSRDSSTRAPL
jgi:hypothetical protein